MLDGAPWLLAEGVLIAAGLRDSRKVELRLPAELNGHEAALLNAVDAIRSLAQVAAPSRQIEVLRNCKPSCWGERPAKRRRHDWSTRRRRGVGSPCCSPAHRDPMRRC